MTTVTVGHTATVAHLTRRHLLRHIDRAVQ
jgi:hypothetical protein